MRDISRFGSTLVGETKGCGVVLIILSRVRAEMEGTPFVLLESIWGLRGLQREL